MGFFLGLLLGGFIALIITPIGLYVYFKYKEAKVRRKIKKMLHNNQILIPLDKKDYDNEMWKDKINIKAENEKLVELGDKLFKRGKYISERSEEQ